jgi:hypothetical protein
MYEGFLLKEIDRQKDVKLILYIFTILLNLKNFN